MKFWPNNQKQLRKTTTILLLAFFLAVGFSIFLGQKYKKLSQFPPCATVSSFHLQPYAPSCPQSRDDSGWTLQNDQIRIFPRCLTVMNSRFGSRFNLDWYFSNQQTTSSVLGSLEDQNAYLTLKIKDEKATEQIFPLLPNGSFPIQSVDLGLTYQKINFENDNFLLSLKITSPFSPSQSIKDQDSQMNLAPFFYLDLSLNNKTAFQQEKTIIFSFGNAQKWQAKNNLNLVYFHDRVRNDGLHALTAESKTNLMPFVDKQEGGFNWQVKLNPQSDASTVLVYAGFIDGPVITDSTEVEKKRTKFAYTQWFKDLEAVVNFAFKNQTEIRNKTNRFEKTVQNRNLPPPTRWLLGQTFHSYLGNTWLVYDENNKNDLKYFVWEGEFKYLNTLDVAHDYAILEGLYFPWALKLELESWQKSAKKDEFGLVIPHDLGMRFNFIGSQAYGIRAHETSGMPVEENADFILLAYWYWRQTKDDRFIQELSPFVSELTESLIKRDSNGNGLADRGIGMTTYDNDGNSALKEAPDGTYLGIKQLAAYLSAEKIFQSTNDEESQELAKGQSQLISESLKKAYQNYGFIPLSLNSDFIEKSQFNGQEVRGIEEQGFAFITGLFYPAITNLDSPILKELIPILTDSYKEAYQKSLVKSGGEIIGLKLAENQALGLGWFSHSVMADFIAQKLFGQEYFSEEIFFPLLFDNPGSFADGQYFKEPFYPPQTSLIFYPRGVALFSHLLP